MVKNILRKLIPLSAKLLSVLPQKFIVFESKPDFCDNSRAVFDEIVKRELNKKYTLVWLTNNKESKLSIPNVRCAHNRILQLYYSMRAKYLISSNTFATSFGKHQVAIFLGHGFPLKTTFGYEAPPGVDYSIGLSDDTNYVQANEANIDVERVITLGYPRNDALNKKNGDDIRKILGPYNKIVVWYPTFRQHNVSKIQSATTHALPILHDSKIAARLNDFAKSLNILLVLKPHFSQDTRYIKDLNLSNILFIDDSFFVKNNISSYEFVGACDALITDYSSIYFDFLLCDKPVAAIWEDVDEYKKNRGFVVDIDYYFRGAHKIYTFDDFITFLDKLNIGDDNLTEERRSITKEIHKYVDFCSTERVVNFIENLENKQIEKFVQCIN